MLWVLQDVRAVAANHPGEPNPEDWDWEQYDYEVVLTEKFWPSYQTGFGMSKNFRVAYVATDSANDAVSMTAHELGHAFKFQHASYWNGPLLPPGGTLVKYGDFYDPMGTSAPGSLSPKMTHDRHYNPRHKLWARWIAGNRIPAITQEGIYTIRRWDEQGPSGLRGIRIRRNFHVTYFVFYRQNTDGVVITRSEDTNIVSAGALGTPATDTHLLDPVPPFGNWSTAPLLQSEEFNDDSVSIEVRSLTDNDAQLDVHFLSGFQPTTDKPPVIAILNPEPGEILQGNVLVKVYAYDPDGFAGSGTATGGTDYFDGLSKIVVGFGKTPPPGACAEPVHGATTFYQHCKVLTPTDDEWILETGNWTTQNGPHEFFVEAHCENGGPVRAIRFRFFSDN